MLSQLIRIVCGVFLVIFITPAGFADQDVGNNNKNSSELLISDCVKCHLKEIEDIEEAGLAHKTDIDCVDCHPGHRPKAFENIPHCNKCHAEEPHFQQQQCLNCHRNPHRPRAIKLPKKATAACLTCHQTQGVELVQFPSYHSSLECTDCHHEHGELPECMACHLPHADTMTETACRNCHQPHKPLDVSYADEIPSADCGGCHSEALDLLLATKSKHGQLSCAGCHSSRHKTIPKCQNCHGVPHAQGIMDKFPRCGECHGTAHDIH